MTESLSEAEIQEVLDLFRAAVEHDGVAPLSERSLLALRGLTHPRKSAPKVRLLRSRDSGALAGYSHLDPPHDDEPASAELVVHPEHRRRGYGRTLARDLLQASEGPLRVWAHGDLPAAAALAASLGLTRERALHQLQRPLSGELPPVPALPEGITLRTFEPSLDETEWLEVNHRAFAHHPEQGAWTLDDLRAREAEPWFDPAGFFLAVRLDGRIVGFHWTKVHPGSVGEVYVVGVDPAAQGLGLGRALTLAGLHHLRALGLEKVMLYVDESNTSARKLYATLGFEPLAVDVMYA
jgi:mycothiol synthase